VREWDTARRRYTFYEFGDVIWRMENLDGRSDEEQYTILVQRAFSTSIKANDPYPSTRARWTLAKRWPVRWRGYLADHYREVAGRIGGIEGQGPRDRLTDLIAADETSEGRYRAMARIFLATGDPGSMKRLEDAAASEKAGNAVGLPGGYSAVDTLAWCALEQRGPDMAGAARSVSQHIPTYIAYLAALPTEELKGRFADEKDDQERARILSVLWARARGGK
jgi:hypothetical protein